MFSCTEFEVNDLRTGLSISENVYVSSIDGKYKLVIVADYRVDEKGHGPIMLHFDYNVNLSTLIGDHNGKFDKVYCRRSEFEERHELNVGQGYRHSGGYSATGTLVLTMDVTDSSNLPSFLEMGVDIGWFVNPEDLFSRLSTHKTINMKIRDQYRGVFAPLRVLRELFQQHVFDP